MTYQVDVINMELIPLAVVRRQARQQDLSTVIPESVGVVYEFLKTSNIQHLGIAVAIYFDGQINMEVGVKVSSEFESTSLVQYSHIPLGAAATTAHFGDYSELSKANEAIIAWCKQNNKSLTGISWEVYGHWNDDPQKVRTDVYYQIKEGVFKNFLLKESH
jgi:effector-binding domain-containing protein